LATTNRAGALLGLLPLDDILMQPARVFADVGSLVEFATPAADA
jgi:hypothetical protein